MSTKHDGTVHLSRLQFLWILYTVVYVSISHALPDFITPSAFLSSLLITMGSTIVLAITLYSLQVRDPTALNNVLFVILIPWVFFMENTMDRDDHVAFAFASIFFALIGWLIWNSHVEKADISYRRYTVFISMFSAIVCSFVQLVVTNLVKHMDTVLFPAHEYYLIGYHGMGIAIGLLVALWFGVRLLPMRMLSDGPPVEGIYPKLICLLVVLLMALVVYLTYRSRLTCYFGDRALSFVTAYTIVHAVVPLFTMHFALKLGSARATSRIFLAMAIIYPILSSVLASIIVWEFSIVIELQHFLTRWLVFEYIPSLTLGLSLVLSMLGAKTLISRVNRDHLDM